MCLPSLPLGNGAGWTELSSSGVPPRGVRVVLGQVAGGTSVNWVFMQQGPRGVLQGGHEKRSHLGALHPHSMGQLLALVIMLREQGWGNDSALSRHSFGVPIPTTTPKSW